jgi:membrane associated rhomboid family serine protease
VFFFPYRPDFSFFVTPWLTILVCLGCIGTGTAQWLSENSVKRAAQAYCSTPMEPAYEALLKRGLGRWDTPTCRTLMVRLRNSTDPRTFLERVVIGDKQMRAQPGLEHKRRLIGEMIYRHYAYESVVPRTLTERIWYSPLSWNPIQMLTATFAHGDWKHLANNMFFFFAFAAAVEIIIGPLRFALTFVALSLGAFSVYSASVASVALPAPTLGLSGVVYGMMALFAWFTPWTGVRWLFVVSPAFCSFWIFGLIPGALNVIAAIGITVMLVGKIEPRIFLIVPRVVIPAWFMAAWFVVIDGAQLLIGQDGAGVNLVAHVAGAGLGLGLGFVFFGDRRREFRERMEASASAA